MGLDRMLRPYFLQHWFSLPDEAVEDAMYDMPLFRRKNRPMLGGSWDRLIYQRSLRMVGRFDFSRTQNDETEQ
ncbi:hypothetical protein Ga0074115_1255 [endosymbiont of Ridgeia piscesae]|uniref:Uncharacterized protein n=1 Tax=endosymbiont of Ridgeia piscesae TaxID=54398 RepID=A0A0T5YYY6_9GAMM|nr:hypothetical protein Ga0074115_1255 [endosymbiont of Ridgeia piscesae]KRT56917.1 hypothetical protein Ga0076813_10644 [endosymbiont of Ridgeia piscesae]